MRCGEGGNEASPRIWAMAKAKGVGKTGEKRQVFCARPLNVADVCVLRSGVKCLNRLLLAFQRFKWLYKSPKWRDGLRL